MMELELELEFYLFDRQLHNIGEIISKKMCEIILSGDSHKGTNSAASMRATHQVGYIVQNVTVKNSVIGMQCETILLKGYHDNNNTTSTENTINIGE